VNRPPLSRCILVLLLNANTVFLAYSATPALTVNLVSAAAAVCHSLELIQSRNSTGRGREQHGVMELAVLGTTLWAAGAVGREVWRSVGL